MTDRQNSRCPDIMSHYENACDRLYPDHGNVISPEQDEIVWAEAEIEYLDCEGH